MPHIIDNIQLELREFLRTAMQNSTRADFCVGYFNLRGWKKIDDIVEGWDGASGRQCRLLVGMQRTPHEELRAAYSLTPADEEISTARVISLKRRLAQEFRDQLTCGAPTDDDEAGLRRLCAQLRSGKLVVKLHLRHPLHAKLYLAFRNDPIAPIIGVVGSSNLTGPGLGNQGELNVDVVEKDAAMKLAAWFEGRWNDRWCIDITKELIEIIEESWARSTLVSPYHIYVKMAYHLAEEARQGITSFSIPPDMRGVLLEFQSAAVRIAARHLERRGGVILGDVVGLGKTLMATALARVFQEPPHSLETLIICPKNLERMWDDYAQKYRLIHKVIPITRVAKELPNLRRYRLVIIDESHNLRNREGKTWREVRDYIARNDSRCILLSATPYNAGYLDLSSQLRLFLEGDAAVGIRPEEYLRRDCDGQPDKFMQKHQCALNTLAAFEKSTYPDDWREVMRLFMVRRTRSFVERHYAHTECPQCKGDVTAAYATCRRCGRARADADRRFLELADGRRFYFPRRKPQTLSFRTDEGNPSDQYAQLYSDFIVDRICALHLPRYGIASYIKDGVKAAQSPAEEEIIRNLSRAGKRLIGFCRTSLFKRLESSGHAFLLSVRRHILRNCLVLHALENSLPVPVRAPDDVLYDTRSDADSDADAADASSDEQRTSSLTQFAQAGAAAYSRLQTHDGDDVAWLRADLFVDEFAEHLREDTAALVQVLASVGPWRPFDDDKLAELVKLLQRTHAKEKVLVFSQYADTVRYLEEQLRARGVEKFAAVTGDDADPGLFARRFSPDSNQVRDKISKEDELRVLVSTDVLSEGQNLQDASIVVNYDLPWAIIRLIQRAGRVDRIGQRAESIRCYSFQPAEGVERLLRLRDRLRRRLKENAEVVGTDEAFFEDELHDGQTRDLFTEKSGVLDDPEDDEVDLASYAYQIWKNAVDVDPSLKRLIPDMPPVVFATKSVDDGAAAQPGVMVYIRTADDADALAWVNERGETVTESQNQILRAAACEPSTPPLERRADHHTLVQHAAANVQRDIAAYGGQLGRASSARRRTYERLKQYLSDVKGTLFDRRELRDAVEAIVVAPLTESAKDLLNRELRAESADEALAELVIVLHNEGRLCVPQESFQSREPKIVCSLGIRRNG